MRGVLPAGLIVRLRGRLDESGEKRAPHLHDLHSEDRRNTIGLTQAVMMVSLGDGGVRVSSAARDMTFL